MCSDISPDKLQEKHFHQTQSKKKSSLFKMVYRILPILVLFSVQSLGIPNFEQEFDEWIRATPGTPITPGRFRNCTTDLLILLDISYSVGESEFNKRIKPFLNKIVASPVLNVGHDGTNIAMIIFSNKDNTRVLLKFGDKQSITQLQSYFNGTEFTWALLSGHHTRIDIALQKANQIFTRQSPGNARDEFPDVILIITDGHPQGVANATSHAYDEAEKLRKEKNISIVGAAVGHERNKFKHVLQKIAGSPHNTFDAEFDKLDTILDKLLVASCKGIKPGTPSQPPSPTPPPCHLECPDIQEEFYTKIYGGRVYVLIPPPEAVSDSNDQTCPPVPQPKSSGPLAQTSQPRPTVPKGHYEYYEVGVHISVRKYQYNGNETTCTTTIHVKVKCGGTDFDPEKNTCCCGELLRLKSSDEICCGNTLIDKRTHICCDDKIASFVRKGRSCSPHKTKS